MIYVGDITDSRFIHNVFDIEDPAFIVQLAAREGFRASISNLIEHVRFNVESSTVLLEKARSRFERIKHFVYFSGRNINGNDSKMCLLELNPFD